MPDGRTVALEGHCIALTPAGKPRLHPEALDKDTAASSKVSDWDTLNEGKASVDHDVADPIKQSYNRRVMLMGQKRHTQWIKTLMVPRFRPHPSQRLFEGAFIKRHSKGAEDQIVEGSHGGNSGISRSESDPAVTGEHKGSASPSVAFVDVGPIYETLDGALHDCPCGETTLTTDSDQSVQESEKPQPQRRGLAGGARGDPLIIPGSTGRKLVSAPLS